MDSAEWRLLGPWTGAVLVEGWRRALDRLDFSESETGGTGDSKSVDSLKEFCCKGKKRKEGVGEG